MKAQATIVEETATRANGGATNEPTLLVYSAGNIDPARIPPRGWLLGVTFCRKFISGLIAEGGIGKTAIRYAQFLALASNRELTNEHIFKRSRVLIACLEDDLDEVRRRIGAAMIYHNVSPDEVDGSLFYCCPRGLTMMKTNKRGIRFKGVLDDELRTTIAKHQIDVVGIDPFIKCSGVDENDNAAIDQVCILLAKIADEHNCVIDLVSHSRKGTGLPGDADRDRGASAKKDAGRLMRTVTRMTAEEAKGFGIKDAEEQISLIRVDDAKINLTRKSSKAVWYRLVGVKLGNGDDTYPNGDEVQTVVRWYPPDVDAFVSPEATTLIFDQIEAGPYPQGRYSAAPQATKRAVWPMVAEFCPELSEQQIKQVVTRWIVGGLLRSEPYIDQKSRHEEVGLVVLERPYEEPM